MPYSGVVGLPASDGHEHVLSTLLVRLLVLRNGRLWHSKLVDPMLRGALMVDWAASGRLTDQTTALVLDTTQTGNPAADALLAGIAAEPDRPLIHWLAVEQSTLAGFGGYLTNNGVLVRERGRFGAQLYRDPVADELGTLRNRLGAVIFDDGTAEPATVALAVLAHLLGLLGEEADTCKAATLDRCAHLGWLVGGIQEWAAVRIDQMRNGQYSGRMPSS